MNFLSSSSSSSSRPLSQAAANPQEGVWSTSHVAPSSQGSIQESFKAISQEYAHNNYNQNSYNNSQNNNNQYNQYNSNQNNNNYPNEGSESIDAYKHRKFSGHSLDTTSLKYRGSCIECLIDGIFTENSCHIISGGGGFGGKKPPPHHHHNPNSNLKATSITLTTERSQQLLVLFDVLILESQDKSLRAVLYLFEKISSVVMKLDPSLLDFLLQTYGPNIVEVVKENLSIELFFMIADIFIYTLDAHQQSVGGGECSYLPLSSSFSSAGSNQAKALSFPISESKFMRRLVTLMIFLKELSRNLVGSLLISGLDQASCEESRNNDVDFGSQGSDTFRIKRCCYGEKVTTALISLIKTYNQQSYIVESLYYILSLLIKMTYSHTSILSFDLMLEIETILFESLANCEILEFVPNSYALLFALLSYCKSTVTRLAHKMNTHTHIGLSSSSSSSSSTEYVSSSINNFSSGRRLDGSGATKPASTLSTLSKFNQKARAELFAYEIMGTSQLTKMVSDLQTIGNIMLKFNFRLIPSIKKLCSTSDPNISLNLYFRDLDASRFIAVNSMSQRFDSSSEMHVMIPADKTCDIYFLYLIIVEYEAFARELVSSNLVLTLLSAIELSDFDSWGRPVVQYRGSGGAAYFCGGSGGGKRKVIGEPSMPMTALASTAGVLCESSASSLSDYRSHLSCSSVIACQFLLAGYARHYPELLFKINSDMFSESRCDIYFVGIQSLFNSIMNTSSVDIFTCNDDGSGGCNGDEGNKSNSSSSTNNNIYSNGSYFYHSPSEAELSELLMRIEFAHSLISNSSNEQLRATCVKVFIAIFDAFSYSSFLSNYLRHLQRRGSSIRDIDVSNTGKRSDNSNGSSSNDDIHANQSNSDLLFRSFSSLFDVLTELTTVFDKKKVLFDDASVHDSSSDGDGSAVCTTSRLQQSDDSYCFLTLLTSSMIQLSHVWVEHDDILSQDTSYDETSNDLLYRTINLITKLFNSLNYSIDMQFSIKETKYRIKEKLYELSNNLLNLVKFAERRMSAVYAATAANAATASASIDNSYLVPAPAAPYSFALSATQRDILLDVYMLYVFRPNSPSSSSNSSSTTSSGYRILDKSDIDFLGRPYHRGDLNILHYSIFESIMRDLIDFFCKSSDLDSFDSNPNVSDLVSCLCGSTLIKQRLVDFLTVILLSSNCSAAITTNRNQSSGQQTNVVASTIEGVNDFALFFLSSILSSMRSKNGFLTEVNLDIDIGMIETILGPASNHLRKHDYNNTSCGVFFAKSVFMDSLFVIYFFTMMKSIACTSANPSHLSRSEREDANNVDASNIMNSYSEFRSSFTGSCSGNHDASSSFGKSKDFFAYLRHENQTLNLRPSHQIIEMAIVFSMSRAGGKVVVCDQMHLFDFHMSVCEYLIEIHFGSYCDFEEGGSLPVDHSSLNNFVKNIGPVCLILLFKLFSIKGFGSGLSHLSSFSKEIYQYPEWFLVYDELSVGKPKYPPLSCFSSLNLSQIICAIDVESSLNLVDAYLQFEYSLEEAGKQSRNVTVAVAKVKLAELMDSPNKIKKDTVLMMLACTLKTLDSLRCSETVNVESNNKSVEVYLRVLKFFRCCMQLYLKYSLLDDISSEGVLEDAYTFLNYHTNIDAKSLDFISDLHSLLLFNSSSNSSSSSSSSSSIGIIYSKSFLSLDFLFDLVNELLQFVFFHFSLSLQDCNIMNLGATCTCTIESSISSIERDIQTVSLVFDWIKEGVSSIESSASVFLNDHAMEDSTEEHQSRGNNSSNSSSNTTSSSSSSSLNQAKLTSIYEIMFNISKVVKSVQLNLVWMQGIEDGTSSSFCSLANKDYSQYNDLDTFLTNAMDKLVSFMLPGSIINASNSAGNTMSHHNTIDDYIAVVIDRCNKNSDSWRVTFKALHEINSPLSETMNCDVEARLFTSILNPIICILYSIQLLLQVLQMERDKSIVHARGLHCNYDDGSAAKTTAASINNDDEMLTFSACEDLNTPPLLIDKSLQNLLALVKLRSVEILSTSIESFQDFSSNSSAATVNTLLLILRVMAEVYYDLYELVGPANSMPSSSSLSLLAVLVPVAAVEVAEVGVPKLHESLRADNSMLTDNVRDKSIDPPAPPLRLLPLCHHHSKDTATRTTKKAKKANNNKSNNVDDASNKWAWLADNFTTAKSDVPIATTGRSGRSKEELKIDHSRSICRVMLTGLTTAFAADLRADSTCRSSRLLSTLFVLLHVSRSVIRLYNIELTKQ